MAWSIRCVGSGRTLLYAVLAVAALLAVGTATVAAKSFVCGFATVCNGSNGDDKIRSAGQSNVSGKGGDDSITETAGASVIEGGPGNDVIRARGPFNLIRGDNGNDEIDARNGGEDTIDCGKGTDKVAIDEGLDSVKNCEGELR